MSDVFISHVEEDSSIALEIARGLEQAGYSTWYYERDSLPGVSYLLQTRQAVEQSQGVVVIISQRSLGAHQMTNEVVRAHESRKHFIPVLYDVSHMEFQRRQPEWAEAIGAAASVSIGLAGPAATVLRILEGLTALGVEPSGSPVPPVKEALAPEPTLSTGQPQTTAVQRRSALPVEAKRRVPNWAWAVIAGVVLIAVFLLSRAGKGPSEQPPSTTGSNAVAGTTPVAGVSRPPAAPPTRTPTATNMPRPTRTKSPAPTESPTLLAAGTVTQPPVAAATTPIPETGESGLAADAIWPMFDGGLAHLSRLPFAGPAHPEFSEQSGFYQIGFRSGAAVAADGTRYDVSIPSKYSTNALMEVKGADGVLRWSQQMNHSISSPCGGEVPAISVDGTVYAGSPDGDLYAFAPDGTVKWRFVTGREILSSAAIGADGTIYFGSGDGVVYAVSPAGTLQWKYAGLGRITSSPALDGKGTVYIGGWDGNLYAFSPDGRLNWQFSTAGLVLSSPLITERGVYFGSYDGYLYALTFEGQLRWRFDTGGQVEGSPALGQDGTIYLLGENGTLLAIGEGGEQKWSYGSPNIEKPANADGSEGTTPRVDVHGTVYVPCGYPDVCAIDPNGKFLGYYRPANP